MSSYSTKSRKKVRKNIQSGVAHIQSTFNNTIDHHGCTGKRCFLVFRWLYGFKGRVRVHHLPRSRAEEAGAQEHVCVHWVCL